MDVMIETNHPIVVLVLYNGNTYHNSIQGHG